MAQIAITLSDEEHAMLCDHAMAFGFASLSTAVADLILNYAEAPMDMDTLMNRKGPICIIFGGRAGVS